MKKEKDKAKFNNSWFRMLQIVAVMMAFVLESCVKEPLLGSWKSGRENIDVTFALIPPGAFIKGETRALTDAQQSAISSASVLIYKEGKMISHKIGKILPNNKMEVTLTPSVDDTDQYDIIVIGNQGAVGITDPETYFNQFIGKSEEELKEAMIFPIGDNGWDKTEFIMWGKMNSVLIHPVANNFTVRMLRPLARIDITATDFNGGNSYEVREVYMKGTNNQFALIPNIPADGVITTPTIPPGTEKQKGEIQYIAPTPYSNSLKSTIYIAEVEATSTGPIQLILNLAKQGDPDSYFRVDLRLQAPGSPEGYEGVTFLRNHLYDIKLSRINGAGYPTKEQAEVGALNDIQIEMNPIDEGEDGTIIFDEKCFLYTDVIEVNIHSTFKEEREYTIATIKSQFPEGITADYQIIHKGVIVQSVEMKTDETYPITLTIPPAYPQSLYTCEIRVGRLRRSINIIPRQAYDVHCISAILEGVRVAIIDTPQEWISLNLNELYGYQDIPHEYERLEGSRIYLHLDENETMEGPPRRAIVRTHSGGGMTRNYIEQINYSGLVIGYFGGEFDEMTGYTKQLVVEGYSEPWTIPYYLYDLGLEKNQAQWGEENMLVGAGASSIYFGMENCITLDKLYVSNMTNYSARNCLRKSRDKDKNGYISKEEAIWYLPAQNQVLGLLVDDAAYQRMWYDYTSPYFEYVSSTEIDKDNAYLASSDRKSKLILKNNVKDVIVNNFPQSVYNRCVRELNSKPSH